MTATNRVADAYRTLTAGQWTRRHATELLVALLAAGNRELALRLLREALGMTVEQILGQLEGERARRQADSACTPVADRAEPSCASADDNAPGKEGK